MTRAALLLSALLIPARAAAGTALLWLPQAGAGIGPALDALEREPELRLTLALESQPAETELTRLLPLLAEGRAELALRPPEDPPLFLLYYPNDPASAWKGKRGEYRNNPYFFAVRLLDAKDRLPLYKDYAPKGLAASPGGMAEGAQPALRSLGLSWIAVAPDASTDTPRIAVRDGITAISFDLISSTEAGSPGYQTTAACSVLPCFFVIDGALDAAAGRDSAALLDYWMTVAAPAMTVSDLLRAAEPQEASLSRPPWSGDYNAWAGSPRQAGGVSALAGLRDTITLYMNERPGDKAIKAVMQAYFATGSARELAGLSDKDEERRREAELEFQNRAADVYRLMDKSLPRWIFAPLEKLSPAEEAEAFFTSRRSGQNLELENRPAPPVLRDPLPEIKGGLDPLKALKLRALAISWNDDEVSFTFSAGAGPERGMAEGVSLELYIDVNKRQRAGHTNLLNAENPRLYPEDAWEYALSLAGGKAELFTVGSRRAAANMKAEPVTGGKLTVKVPRRLLAGSPERWGYAAFLFFNSGDEVPALTDTLCAENSGGYVHAARHGK